MYITLTYLSKRLRKRFTMTFIKAHSVTKTFNTLFIRHTVAGLSDFSTSSDKFTPDSTIDDLINQLNEDHSRLLANTGRPDSKWSDGYGGINLQKVLDAGGQLEFKTSTMTYREPASLECCGRRLSLSRFTNTCVKCGADYNQSGSLLAPRSQWGEETGETWTDCYGEY